MKILQLVTSRQYRGAEVFAANLSLELIKFGHEIHFVGLYKNEKNELYVDEARNVDLVRKKKGSFSPLLVQRIVKLVKSEAPDIIQCNGSDTLKYMYFASFFLPRVPIVYRNISIISEWVNPGLKKIIYRNIFKRISHVSSVGENAVRDFLKTFNYPENQTSVVRRGIPLKKIDSEVARNNLIQSLKLSVDDKIAMHIGNFSQEKNHIFLLDAFYSIKKRDKKLKLILVGDGELLEKIQQEVRTKNLEDTVYFLGFRKDIPELLAATDIFVLCSKVEGVPGVILEAAAQEKPSVATNVGGVKEVLRNNETGYIIEDFNKEEFQRKIEYLLKEEGSRKRLGKNAYHLVQQEYNPLINAKKFETLYSSLIKNKN